ncbi:MAG: hypothetical protein A3K19_07270 [Lentisphaerae bacterium RIFOXYB12_FULL_65_16]|nr:MAG: hypothetical protein A3K18_07140 [Lentisphaerae bacterium RIFOXYA12_64_32]OGV93322.1 MAG: hypothetical protein A3K19_07270 [Lentisphaerae bacterium RIFOXYB12_FULL_65_16]
MLKLNPHSIKFKTVAVIVAVLGVVLLFQTLYITPMISKDNFERGLYAQEQIADQIGESADFFFHQAIVELETIAQLSSVQSMEKGLLDESISEIDHLTHFFNHYFVVDRDGAWVSFPSKPFMANQKVPPENMEWVRETVQKNRTIFLDLLVSSFGSLVSGFATPIRSKSGDMVGVLRGVIVVSEENTVLSTVRNTKVGKSGYAYIVTSNGWLIAHPHIALDANEFSIYNYMNYEPVKKVIKGQSGRCEYEYEGATWVAAYRPIKATGWGLIVHQPKTDLLAEARSKARVVSRLFIFAFLFSAIVLVSLIHFEVRPLTDLLKDIRSGDAAAHRVYGKGEIGQLALEFRTLYANLLQSKEALQESEEHFRLLLENDHSVMLLVDPETGVIVDANPAACHFYGYSKPHLTSKKITQINVSPEDEVLENLKEVKSKPQAHYICQHRLAGGDVREVEVYTGQVRMRGRALLHSIVHDITERKRAEDERRKLEAHMQQSQKLESLGVLAGGIAHDFNNLMMGVLASAELALDDIPKGSKAREGVEGIAAAARRAGELGKQMLAYSGKAQFVIKSCDLNEIIHSMAHLLKASISKKAVLKHTLAPNLPSVEADGTQISQIVLNLVTNASQAIGDANGEIVVSTGVRDCDGAYLAETYLDEQLAPGRYVYFQVTDTGCGIDPETVTRIFDPFFTTKAEGRGLGLSLVLGIVRGHKGALKVESEIGKGSKFTVLFPCSYRLADDPQKKAPAKEEQRWTGTGTVLVVDDEEIVRQVADRMLQKLGFKVITAVDGVDGVEKFRKHAQDIAAVVLDLSMPRMDGEEAFNEIRRLRPDAVVVLSSGYDAQEATSRFAGKGLSAFLQKPYRLDKLAEKMREVLSGPKPDQHA